MTSLATRLDEALAIDAPVTLLSGDLHDADDFPDLRQAAVLVAITDRTEPGVILTERSADLRQHGGQVAFPGGRIDEGETAIQAALRESWEELALDPAEVNVIRTVDPYRTITGFGVTPVIGVVPPDLVLTPNPAEVADWFEAPLGHLLDPANHERQVAHFRGQDRRYFQINWQGRRIWGATAAMLINLSRRLRWN